MSTLLGPALGASGRALVDPPHHGHVVVTQAAAPLRFSLSRLPGTPPVSRGAGNRSDRTGRGSLRTILESSGVPFQSAEHRPRHVLFRQGDVSDQVLHIESGKVVLAVSTRSGREAICGVLGSGAFLGEETLIGQPVRRHSAVALAATVVLVIAKAHLLELLHTQPAVADRFIEQLVLHRTRLEYALADQLLYPAEQRLAHTLLALAGCDVWTPCRCVLPDVSQELIAEMVGTTRSRVNVFMGRFRRAGFVEKDGRTLYVRSSRLPMGLGGVGLVEGAGRHAAPQPLPPSSASAS